MSYSYLILLNPVPATKLKTPKVNQINPNSYFCIMQPKTKSFTYFYSVHLLCSYISEKIRHRNLIYYVTTAATATSASLLAFCCTYWKLYNPRSSSREVRKFGQITTRKLSVNLAMHSCRIRARP